MASANTTTTTPSVSPPGAAATETTTPARRPHAPGTRVRQLDFSNKIERHAATLLLMRSFTFDGNVQRYLGGIKPPGIPLQPTTVSRGDVSKLPIDTRCMYYLFAGLIGATALTGGRVMAVVEPAEEPSSDKPRDWLVVPTAAAETSKLKAGSDGEKSATTTFERFLAVALWHCPGARIDDLSIAFRSRQDRTMTGGGYLLRGWGIRFAMRALDTQGRFVKNHKKACAERNIEHSTCWTLEVLGTDPDADGRGYGALAIREGISHIDSQSPPRPCLLEASLPRPKAIYTHFGWEETSTIVVGEGRVDARGFLCGKDVDRPGVTAWTMLRPARV